MAPAATGKDRSNMKLMKDTMAKRRECSIHRRLEVVATDVGAWRELAEYHYRPGRPGAVDKVFGLREKDREENRCVLHDVSGYVTMG